MLNFPVEKPYDYEVVQAMWTLERFPKELLPDVAGEAMVDGWDGPAVLALVSYSPPDLSGIEKAAALAFAEMGLEPMTPSLAVTRVMRYLARLVVAGEVDPCDWCQDMGQYWMKEMDSPCKELEELFFLSIADDDHAECRAKTRWAIMNKARELAAR